MISVGIYIDTYIKNNDKLNIEQLVTFDFDFIIKSIKYKI